MTSKTGLAVAAVAGAVAGFLAARLAAPASELAGDDVAAEIRRLSDRVERLETALRQRAETPSAEPAPRRDGRASEPPRDAQPAPAPTADVYASWTDDEIVAVALSKPDDLGILKAGLRRELPAERRAALLVALAALRHRIEWHCGAEREALLEATSLAPTTTAVGADAAMALGYAYAARPADRWRCEALFESVLRDAPNEAQRMRGAYGLAWRHDLGDDTDAAAATAYREFLAKWGETWRDTPEVAWARERVELHERAK